MHNDIEELINDNLSLRKSHQHSKTQNEALQKQLQTLKQKTRQLSQSNSSLIQQNSTLTQKNKSLLAQLNNTNASFVSQIQEMKALIEQKENQLENFQIKMIPSLDQDMVRVRLIAEMEGPYQEAVQKRDREIGRLKDQMHLLRREKEMAEYSLESKEREYRKEIEELKIFYDAEIDRLTRQLTHLSHKSHSGKVDKDILRSYRQEIDQLRTSCEFHKNAEEQIRKELNGMRTQRERLLMELANANAQKAIQIRESSNQGALRELKSTKARLEDQLANSQREAARLKDRLKAIQEEKIKKQQKYEWQIKQLKSAHEQDRQRWRNETNDLKDEIRKLRELSNRKEQQNLQLSQKYRLAISNADRLSEEISSLKIKINSTAVFNYSESQQIQRYKRVEEVQRTVREKIQKETVERLEKEIRKKIREEVEQEQGRRRQEDGLIRGDLEKIFRLVSDKIDRETLQKFELELRKKIREELADQQRKRKNEESPKREGQSKQSKTTIKGLQQKIRKLTQKLQFANRKILELLKQKAQRGSDEGQTDLGRTRSHSYSPQHDYNRILLEHRDCSFVPMCPPVVVSHLDLIPPF